MQLVKGRITGIAADSRGILHIHLRKGFHIYELWAADEDVMNVLVNHHENHGAFMEVDATPIYVRFNNISYEIVEVIQDS